MIIRPKFGRSGRSAGRTILLAHCEGTDASTTITDSSSLAKTITAVGDAQIDTAQAKFGSASILCDGTGDRINLGNDSDFAFAGDFTIELWFKCAAVGLYGLYSSGGYNTANALTWVLNNTDSNKMYVTRAAVAIFVGSNTSLMDGNWHHYAVVGLGSTIYGYADGVLDGSGSRGAAFVAQSVGFGSQDANPGDAARSLNGWMDEIRVRTDGVYTGAFTPTGPFAG